MTFRSTTAEHMRRALFELLPPGAIWVRELDNRLASFLLGTAEELTRAHNLIAGLIDEADPRTTDDLLEDWERVLGLPEPCDPSPSADPAIRRALLTAKIRARGGQTPSYIKGIADDATGEACTVHEWGLEPFVAGSDAGELLYSRELWAHWWSVEIPNVDPEYFVAGDDAGVALSIYPSAVSQLACILDRVRPAQTLFFFTYPNDDPLT